MQHAPLVSTFAAQLVAASNSADEAEAKGQDHEAMKGILRSLRTTLASIVQGRDPQDLARTTFSLFVCDEGYPVVRHGGKRLPVSGAYLSSLLSEAGVKLVPGQVILLDRAFANLLIEEALANHGMQAAVLEKEKATLLSAHFAVDGEAHVPTPPPRRPESDAA